MRTLLDRNESIVTEKIDKQQQEERIKHALSQCGYPGWTISKVKQQMNNKTKNKGKKKDTDKAKSNGMVVIHISKASPRGYNVFLKKKHNIATAMRPYNKP